MYGGSGAGKSASYVIPNALQLIGSYVFTDPKGELYDKTAGYFKSKGYDIKVLNLVDKSQSDNFNPLMYIRRIKKEYKEKHEIKKMPFDEVKEGYILKWSYYNEQIAGTRYLNIDYSKLKCGDELRLEKDPLNAHDKNAIKVYYKEMHIGFIHKNYIQEMFNKYSVDETFRIYVRLNSINEAEKRLSLEIGFYKRFEKKDYPILAIYKCAIYDTDKYLSNWDKVSNNEYVSIDLNDTAYVVSEGKRLGTLKYNECKYLYTLSGDFRYVGKIYSLDKKDNSVVGRVEIYVIKL